MRDLFDLDGDGKLNAVEMAWKYDALFSDRTDDPADELAETEDNLSDGIPETEDYSYAGLPSIGDGRSDLADDDFGLGFLYEEPDDEDDGEEDAEEEDPYDGPYDAEDGEGDDMEREAEDGTEGPANPMENCKDRLSLLLEQLTELRSDLADVRNEVSDVTVMDPFDAEAEATEDELDDILSELDQLIDRVMDLSL